jgi:hypothetical protein
VRHVTWHTWQAYLAWARQHFITTGTALYSVWSLTVTRYLKTLRDWLRLQEQDFCVHLPHLNYQMAASKSVLKMCFHLWQNEIYPFRCPLWSYILMVLVWKLQYKNTALWRLSVQCYQREAHRLYFHSCNKLFPFLIFTFVYCTMPCNIKCFL